MHAASERFPGHEPRRWRTALTSVLTALLVIASGGSVAAATAPTAHGPEGTTAARSGPGKQAMVKYAAAQAASDATGALSTISAQTLHGGYVAAGIGMRNLGHGTISVTGVPSKATVKSATLLWDVLANQADPTFAQGTFNGHAINGSAWASGGDPCWGVNANFSYEADVTSLVKGNGSYTLSGFASGQSDGADPWNSGSAPPLLEGATLVVVYQLASMPSAVIQIAEGATETDSGNSATATISGFSASGSPSVKTSYIVADGQYAGNSASFNGDTLPGVGFPGAAPQAVPNYSLGNLWDTVTTKVSALVLPKDTSASLSVTGYSDCIVWVGQVLQVSNAGVLGFGDSVAAGYGLGPSEGNPDNPDAYSALLAKALGNVPVKNFAVEGACASSSERGCRAHSVNWQIAKAKKLTSAFKPSVITLTVGADDINFGGCLESIFTNGDIAMRASKDPCRPAELRKHLTALRHGLGTDLRTLSARYPGTPILVMDYYNPFPPPPGAKGGVCGANQLATILYERHQLKSWWKAAYLYVRHHGRFMKDARSYQKRLYHDAQNVLRQLNSTINTTAARYASVITTGNFSGHNMCAKKAKWVFAPTGGVKIYLHAGPFHWQKRITTGNNQICPDPVSSADWNLRKTVHFHIGKHRFGHITVGLGVNCMPHPRLAGQKAIAQDFRHQGKLK